MTKLRRYTNAFEAVGFPPAEAEHLRIRADLMLEVERLIAARGLTQAEAAKVLHVTQPRISDLTRGKIDRFSIDTWWRCCRARARTSRSRCAAERARHNEALLLSRETQEARLHGDHPARQRARTGAEALGRQPTRELRVHAPDELPLSR